MSLLDQFFIYHPHPWEEGDWSAVGGYAVGRMSGFRLAMGRSCSVGMQSSLLLLRSCCGVTAMPATWSIDWTIFVPYIGWGSRYFSSIIGGMGKSQGRPSEDGLYQDAVGAYDYLTRVRRIRPERLVIFRSLARRRGGRGIGDAAACHGAVAGVLFPFDRGGCPPPLYGFAAALVAGSRVSIRGSAVAHLSLPKLFVHGDRDDIIPIELGRQAFVAAKAIRRNSMSCAGADHNDVPSIGGRAYFVKLSAFICRCARSLNCCAALSHHLRFFCSATISLGKMHHVGAIAHPPPLRSSGRQVVIWRAVRTFC
jgi:hypothetical protein